MLVWKKISLFPCLLALIRVCSNSNFLPTSNPACLIELLVKGSFFLSAPKCKVFLSALLDKINFSSLPSINDVRFFYTFQPLPSFLLKKSWKLVIVWISQPLPSSNSDVIYIWGSLRNIILDTYTDITKYSKLGMTS